MYVLLLQVRDKKADHAKESNLSGRILPSLHCQASLVIGQIFLSNSDWLKCLCRGTGQPDMGIKRGQLLNMPGFSSPHKCSDKR